MAADRSQSAPMLQGVHSSVLTKFRGGAAGRRHVVAAPSEASLLAEQQRPGCLFLKIWRAAVPSSGLSSEFDPGMAGFRPKRLSDVVGGHYAPLGLLRRRRQGCFREARIDARARDEKWLAGQYVAYLRSLNHFRGSELWPYPSDPDTACADSYKSAGPA